MLQTMHDMEHQKSLFKQAADWGLPFGIYLSVMASGFIFSDKHIAISAFALAMVLVIPFLIYRWLKKRYNAEGGKSSFSNLWMMGILIFMGGSLIASGVSYAVIEFLRPNYFYEQAQHLITQYELAPEQFAGNMEEVISLLRLVIEKHAAPRSVELALTGFWACSFAGSLLSALIAALIKLTGKPHND